MVRPTCRFTPTGETQLGVKVPSTVMVAPMSRRFVKAFERLVETQGVDLAPP